MKRLIAPLAMGALLATSVVADDSLKAEIEALKAQMAELKKAQEAVDVSALQKQFTEVKAHDAGDNIKWDVDFRTAYDILDQKFSQGSAMTGVYHMAQPGYGMFSMPYTPEKTNNSLWTNKLILGMSAQPVDNLVFKGSLGFYKTFGQSNIGTNSMFQDFDWYNNQKPQSDNSIRLREAYFLYFGQMGDVKYTASFGRRPSTDGFMINLREDNVYPASPVGHNINMQFDGASFKFDLEKQTGLPGFYVKLCLGRGFSETYGSYSMSEIGFNSAYSKDDVNPNMDLAGLLIQAYDNGQYKVMANVFQGWNMMGIGMNIAMDGNATDGTYSMTPSQFYDVGDMQGASLSLQVNGIGNEINDFLDDTVAFASVAMMKTDPNNITVNAINGSTAAAAAMGFGGEGMLGSTDKETGYSYYVGVNIPGFMESDRIGIEYNHGSKYWRSFTYGEDTLAGSKLATRGDAYEIYYTLPLVAKNLTAQIRATYFDYKYAGSDTFFGQSGNPLGMMGVMPYVESASNIRLSMRYRY
jgi:hypothetical protein